VLAWLARPDGGAALLRELTNTDAVITHERLDALRPRVAVVGLRHMLVHVGALPVRAEALEGLPAWLERKTATVPAQYRQVISVYGYWSVFRRARHRARRSRFTIASAAHARGQVCAAMAFVRWLDERGLQLGRVRQIHLDEWLTAGPAHRRRVKDFLRWTHQRGLS